MNHSVDFHYFTVVMQRSCSDTFRNGQTLVELRQQLRDGIVNPLDDDRLNSPQIGVLHIRSPPFEVYEGRGLLTSSSSCSYV